MNADVTFRVLPGGSIAVTDRLTYEFHGRFDQAAFFVPQLLPASAVDIAVLERGEPYAATGDPAVGSSSPSGTFGSVELVGPLNLYVQWRQIVWHFDATNTTRTFTIRYRLRDLVDLYRDVGDVNLRVWNDEPVPLGRLHAEVILPGEVRRTERGAWLVWLHPANLAVRVSRRRDRLVFDVESVPDGQFIDLETTFPSRLLAQAKEVQRQPVYGLREVVDRERRFAASQLRRLYGTRYGLQPKKSSGSPGGSSHVSFWPLLAVLAGLLKIAIRILSWRPKPGTGIGVRFRKRDEAA